MEPSTAGVPSCVVQDKASMASRRDGRQSRAHTLAAALAAVLGRDDRRGGAGHWWSPAGSGLHVGLVFDVPHHQGAQVVPAVPQGMVVRTVGVAQQRRRCPRHPLCAAARQPDHHTLARCAARAGSRLTCSRGKGGRCSLHAVGDRGSPSTRCGPLCGLCLQQAPPLLESVPPSLTTHDEAGELPMASGVPHSPELLGSPATKMQALLTFDRRNEAHTLQRGWTLKTPCRAKDPRHGRPRTHCTDALNG
nr:uncharacterized protein LOC118971057 isoform X2 [Manis javanica]